VQIERLVLAVALVVPLGIMAVSVPQLAGFGLVGQPSSIVRADGEAALRIARPQPASRQAPPPTLAPPTPTPKPTATAVPTAVVVPTATVGPRTYQVQPGDELRHIAAQYGVNIWSIINANDIPNPDSLRIGQVLKIPER
jgi:LysM repeat protein